MSLTTIFPENLIICLGYRQKYFVKLVNIS